MNLGVRGSNPFRTSNKFKIMKLRELINLLEEFSKNGERDNCNVVIEKTYEDIIGYNTVESQIAKISLSAKCDRNSYTEFITIRIK